jgi:hypothetical protein
LEHHCEINLRLKAALIRSFAIPPCGLNPVLQDPLHNHVHVTESDLSGHIALLSQRHQELHSCRTFSVSTGGPHPLEGQQPLPQQPSPATTSR